MNDCRKKHPKFSVSDLSHWLVSNVQVWRQDTPVSPDWPLITAACDYCSIPLSSESLLVPAQRNDYMGRGRVIGPHRESGTSLNLSPTSTLQAEVSLHWNGIHGSGSGRSSLHLQTATFHSAKSLFGAFWYFLVLFGSFFRKWFVASLISFNAQEMFGPW